MLHKKISVHNVRVIYNAFSLVEILLSLMLGTVILFAMVNVYSQIYRNEDRDLERLNLQMQTHQSIEYFKQHIQHSGYVGKNREHTNYRDFLIDNKSYQLKPNCLLFFYDINQDGYIGILKSKNIIQEVFGFKFYNQELLSYKLKREESAYKRYSQQKSIICNSVENWESMAKDFRFLIKEANFKKLAAKLIQIDLVTASRKYPELVYKATAYTYLLNDD